MSPDERKALAMQEAATYRQRVAEGNAESREEFLAQHEEKLSDLLEPLPGESRTTANPFAGWRR